MPPCSARFLPVRRTSARSTTDNAIGTIIAAVAVFDTHMLRNAVAPMIPANTTI